MDTTVASGSGIQAGRREWIGLAVLALPTLLLSVDIGVLYLALPHLSADLGADSTQQLWILDIYSFMLAGFLVTMGTLHNPRQMGLAIGVWFSCFVGGMTLGPLVGGVLLEHFWWGSAFLLGVPFMVLLLVAGPMLLPESGTPGRDGWIRPAWPCRWPPSCRSSTASRNWPVTAGSRCPSRPSWSAWWSASCSCIGSAN
jgi:MFS family permease